MAPRLIHFYKHDQCGTRWVDADENPIDELCPKCSATISPHRSLHMDQVREVTTFEKLQPYFAAIEIVGERIDAINDTVFDRLREGGMDPASALLLVNGCVEGMEHELRSLKMDLAEKYGITYEEKKKHLPGNALSG